MEYLQLKASAETRPDTDHRSRPAQGVPVGYLSVFHALAEGAVRLAAAAPRQEWTVCADARTLPACLAQLMPSVRQLVVFGKPAPLPPGLETAEFRNPQDVTLPGEQFLLLQGDESHFCLYAKLLTPDRGSDPDCEGIWSTDPVQVGACVAGLLGEAAEMPPERMGGSQSMTLGLAALHAEALAASRRDIVRDKADLFSVLDILKSISTKRRAHDVLYVFVEHIARVVEGLRRCSVVRIWSDQQTGHVLASHEDQTLQEYCIALDKYPELSLALETSKTVDIPDVAVHPITRSHAEALRKAQISSLIVIPIVLFDEEIGSLFLRAARSNGAFQQREISFLQIAAEAASSALERAQLFDNVQRANEQLARLAKTDGLTGLYNYRHFRDRIEEEHSRAMRYGPPLSCMIIDVDDFKAINDRHGHLAGDAVLRAIAQRTLRSIRTLDIVARYGGEEFAVIMPQTDVHGALVEAERLREAVGTDPFDLGGNSLIHVTVSLGIAQLDAERMATADGLVHAADEALYQAKHNGKNQVCVHRSA